MKEMGIKTKCGLRRAHFGQNCFWRQERERRARVEEKSRFWWEIIASSYSYTEFIPKRRKLRSSSIVILWESTGNLHREWSSR